VFEVVVLGDDGATQAEALADQAGTRHQSEMDGLTDGLGKSPPKNIQ